MFTTAAAANPDGHLMSPVWIGVLGLAVAYIVMWVLTAGGGGTARLIRVAASIPVAAAISAGLVFAYWRANPAKVATSAKAGGISVHAELIWGWAGAAALIALVLIVVSSLIVAARPKRPGRAARRSRGTRTAAPYYPPQAYATAPSKKGWRR